ncbi:acyl carrier protein [Myceligenerans halotolerans]
MTGSDPTPAPTTQDLEAWLTEQVVGFGTAAVDQVTPTTPLAELGLDSVYALALCGEIEDAYGIEVDATIAWDHPTIQALAVALAEKMAE